MVFSSTVFLYLFLPVVLFFNFVVFRKSRLLQNVFLLFASLLFYAYGEPKFVLVMIASIFVNWLFGFIISKNRDKVRLSRLIIVLDVAFNIGLLFVFKYLNFFKSTINLMFYANLNIPDIALPIGISFFTFQAMSYVIDVYRKNGEVQTNILYVGLYISFFPQLIAGPIVRYETVADQIKNRKETLDDFFDGFARFTVGLSKKVLLANNFAIIADQAFNAVEKGKQISVMFSWLGIVAYSLQIFFDFSGYSDMAIGLGRMFGFHFLENFNYPYISTSITEFWRRWHISLGTWFRDYLYFPLGGSRCGKWRNILNLFVVWLLTGLWHGANYTFIVWGLLYFALLVIEKNIGLHKIKGKFINVIKWFYTILFVMIGWTIFRSNTMHNALIYIGSMFGVASNSFSDGIFSGWFMQNAVMLIIGILLSTPIARLFTEKTKSIKAFEFIKVCLLIILLVLSVSNLVASSYNPFIYFNF